MASNVDEARADVRALNAQRAAQFSVHTARQTLGYTKVVAPMDGTVVAIVAQEGQTVNAVQTAPTIVKLADLDTMIVKAQISEADVMRVKPGQRTYFTTLGDPQKKYHGILSAVAPAPESLANDTSGIGAETAASSTSQTNNAVYYDGLFQVPNPKRLLRPSMTAEVHVVLGSAHQALVIPLSALEVPVAGGKSARIGVTEQSEVQVLTPSGGLETRRVRLGMRTEALVEVLSGLHTGEQVVIGESSSASSSPGG